ncbi:PrsW family intramembrane metalloprotease [Zafaria sp. Z1313]|uniref:PrsW family intramembrane metalloprotease n=1 Tax=Zafaria sp. Z1313 TaxID=3423202 RepID=UPI003D3019E7
MSFPPHPVGPGGAPVEPARQPAASVWSGPPRHRVPTGTGTVLAVVACTVVLVAVALVLASSLGSSSFAAVGLAALVPLGICLTGLWWVDRWDPEPKSFAALALLWGAGASVVVTLALNLPASWLLSAAAPGLDAELASAVVLAPVTEELAKGLGLLLVFWLARSHFDGPVDGIVYGGLVGAGFAFTENILYFSGARAEGGAELAAVFVLRGLMSPFAHVLFTAWTGFALGMAASRGRRRAWPAYFLLGLAPATAGHFLWNGGLALFFEDFFSFYFLLQVPLFLASIAAVWMLRRSERRLTEERLGDYARAGWFTEQEVAMLATGPGRRAAAAWARGRGAHRQMRAFTTTALRLAAVRHRILRGHHPERDRAEEHRLLEASLSQRGELLGLLAAGR